MRKVIDGKIFDTETAALVCDISPTGFSQTDFAYEDTGLYKSPKGAFFIAGKGGPLSCWAESEGVNGTRGGSGLALIGEADAKALCERHGTVEEFAKAFGKPVEG